MSPRGELLLAAFPLTWPERQRRTPRHQRRPSRFEVGLAASRDHLLAELGRLRARHVVISSNIAVRRDGLPYAAREPEDSGVAVYFERQVRGTWLPFVIACDAFLKVKENLRAIGLTVESLRAIERHGASEMLEAAFTGFAALPPPAPAGSWWVVLGLAEDASRETVRSAYRKLAFERHPDRGGDPDRWAELNDAIEIARKEGRA